MNNLEDIKNRLAKAVDLGGWTAKHPSFGDSWIAVEKPNGFTNVTAIVATRIDHDDAEFIAHAPDDIARLVKALEAVAELADSYEMTAGMIRHTPNDKALLNAAARDIRRTIATVMNS